MKKIKNHDWRQIVRQIAPTIGVALGGPFAGLAMQSLSRAVFPDADDIPSEDAFRRVLAGGNQDLPAAMKRIQSAEKDFVLQMRRLDLDADRLVQMDRHSARERQAAMGDHFPNILGGFVLFGFFSTVGFVLVGGLEHVDGGAMTLIGSIIGYVSAKADQVVAFFFGSSSSSREKTRALTKAFDKK
ncbi:MAG: hypothetical protein ACON4J_08005 [Parvibaculales bacterium]